MASPSSQSCAVVDDTFGPWAGPDCRGGFDFTLLFIEIFLSILPLALILSIAPFRIVFLWWKQTKIVRSSFLYTKLVRTIDSIPIIRLTIARQIAWVVLAGFDLALLVVWARLQTKTNRAALPSAALNFVGAIILGLLSFFEHLRSLRPSLLLNLYLLFTVLFDIERSRSYALNPNLDVVASIFSTRVGVKVILAILEARGKRRFLLPEYVDCPPEATSGMYKRASFWWLNELFKKGYSNSIAVDDLFILDKHLRADYLHHRLSSAWERCKYHAILSIVGISTNILRLSI